MTNKESFPDRESTPIKLDDEEISGILKFFGDERLRADEHPEFFTVHLKNKVSYIPKWEQILYKGGQKVKIKDELKNILAQT